MEICLLLVDACLLRIHPRYPVTEVTHSVANLLNQTPMSWTETLKTGMEGREIPHSPASFRQPSGLDENRIRTAIMIRALLAFVTTKPLLIQESPHATGHGVISELKKPDRVIPDRVVSGDSRPTIGAAGIAQTPLLKTKPAWAKKIAGGFRLSARLTSTRRHPREIPCILERSAANAI